MSALVGLLDYQLVHQLEQVKLIQQEAGKELVIKEDGLEVAQEVKMLERTDDIKDRLGMIGVCWEWKGCNLT